MSDEGERPIRIHALADRSMESCVDNVKPTGCREKEGGGDPREGLVRWN